MAAVADTTGQPIDPDKDLGEGAEDFADEPQGRPAIEGIPDEGDDDGNDLIDDAQLAVGVGFRDDVDRGPDTALADRKHHKALKDSFDCSDPLPANPGAD